nr:uncharacterized protein LOC112013014 [Quercus suber]POF20541.1 hypothetical protein CFP56_51938 [Quercus suber]
MHALWYCSSLLVIWKDDAMLMKLLRYKFRDFDALLVLVFSMRNRLNIDLLALFFWLIWRNRNAARFKEKKVELHRIRDTAKDLLSDFLAVQVSPARADMPRNRLVRWCPPVLPHIKINFDAALFKELDSTSMGIVVRNCSGTVSAALSQRVPLPFSAATVEALACRRAMEFAKEISAMDCIFEGDPEVLIKAICREDASNPEYGLVIEDILVLARDFHFISFNHVKRSGNQLAHHLARCSKSGCELQVWFDTIPGDIALLVVHDVL